MADTAALLGHTSDELYYDDIASRMKSAIQKGLIDDDGKMPLDFMGSYVLAIAFDLAPERKKKKYRRTFDPQDRRKRGIVWIQGS